MELTPAFSVKSDGRTAMTSDFVTILDGILTYNDEAWDALKDSEIVKNDIEVLGEDRARRAGVILDVSSVQWRVLQFREVYSRLCEGESCIILVWVDFVHWLTQ